MLNLDFSKYAETWVSIVDTNGDVWQGWVSDVDYPDETDDGLWYLGFENMLQNGKLSPVSELNQSEIKNKEAKSSSQFNTSPSGYYIICNSYSGFFVLVAKYKKYCSLVALMQKEPYINE